MKRLLILALILAFPVHGLHAGKSGKVRAKTVSNDLDTTTDAATAINTACDSNTDWSYTATASLTCANTGNIAVGGNENGWKTVSLGIYYIYSSATHVKVQCDEAFTTTGPWHLVTICDSTGTCTKDERSFAVSKNEAFKLHFEINDKWARCRVWGTSADSSDKVTGKVRLMADGGGI